jgi:hypothetical protein
MKDYDVVRIKDTVLRTPLFGDEPIEIRAGCKGTIIDYAETDAPLLEIDVWRDVEEGYPGVIRAEPILVHVERTNLEVV